METDMPNLIALGVIETLLRICAFDLTDSAKAFGRKPAIARLALFVPGYEQVAREIGGARNPSAGLHPPFASPRRRPGAWIRANT
jgi:hypothetical protein